MRKLKSGKCNGCHLPIHRHDLDRVTVTVGRPRYGNPPKRQMHSACARGRGDKILEQKQSQKQVDRSLDKLVWREV